MGFTTKQADKPLPTLAELIHMLERVRLAALADGDLAAAESAAAGKAALERRRVQLAHTTTAH